MIATDFLRCTECRALNEPQAVFCSRCGASLYGPVHGGTRKRRRGVTPAGAVIGVALLLLLGITVFVLGVIVQRTLQPGEEIDTFSGQAGTTATIGSGKSPGSSGAGSNTSSSLGATLVRPTSTDASSTLKATSTNSYRVTNLVDGDLSTAWSEGVDGPGLGEWVQFEFSQETVLSRVEIANGYQKDDDRFLGNPRVKALKVEYSDGTSQLVDLLDSKEPQAITPTRRPVEWVKLVIVSVYAGDQWDDTALSEVRIYAQSN